MLDTLIIRDALDADLPFVCDSWLTNYQHTSYFARRIPKQTFMECHATLINLMIDRFSTVIKVAGDKSHTIFGYIVAEHVKSNPIIHYIYVRPEYQHLGIGKKLFDSLELDQTFEVSHWVPLLNELEKRFKKLKYNPYRI